MFQDDRLLPWRTVEENAALPLRYQGVPRMRALGAARWLLQQAGLGGELTRRPDELSGGMKKRVAIARSLAMNPDLILYDEPTAELDPVTTDELANTILKLKETTKNTMVIVTHDLNFALYISDRIAMMHGGSIVEIGTPREDSILAWSVGLRRPIQRRLYLSGMYRAEDRRSNIDRFVVDTDSFYVQLEWNPLGPPMR